MGLLLELASLIGKKSILQKKALNSYVLGCDQEFVDKADQYLLSFSKASESMGIDIEFMADSYVWMTNSILVEQTYFLRSGGYRYSTLEDADTNIYSNKDTMLKYMIGVALSQVFWKNHREMLSFFGNTIKGKKGDSYLEIGPGHGMFLLEALTNSNFEKYHAVDISETSLDLTKRVIDHSSADKSRLSFFHNDISKHGFVGEYDFITMGEVLEHVEKPVELIENIVKHLKKNGLAYISTCANCPVMDHIYLFRNIDEIRIIIETAGLIIIDELIIPIDDIPSNLWEEKHANISYACIAVKP